MLHCLHLSKQVSHDICRRRQNRRTAATAPRCSSLYEKIIFQLPPRRVQRGLMSRRADDRVTVDLLWIYCIQLVLQQIVETTIRGSTINPQHLHVVSKCCLICCIYQYTTYSKSYSKLYTCTTNPEQIEIVKFGFRCRHPVPLSCLQFTLFTVDLWRLALTIHVQFLRPRPLSTEKLTT